MSAPLVMSHFMASTALFNAAACIGVAFQESRALMSAPCPISTSIAATEFTYAARCIGLMSSEFCMLISDPCVFNHVIASSAVLDRKVYRRSAQTRGVNVGPLRLRMPLNPAPTLCEPLDVAVVTSRSDLRAPSHRIPRRIGPFSLRSLLHASFPDLGSDRPRQ